ncbi:MAG: FAD-dependent oxidoreductase [Candidatus Hydrogenedentes bacterium]|nr:FAD-dependent oxidoreductase [Candidatus Hydrogenedentota bacterium]
MAGAGALTTYSLLVNAGAAEAPPLPVAETAADRFGPIAPPPDSLQTAAAEPHMLQVDLACDFLVAGGGMAGVCAAIAAARHGLRVVLVQDRSRLGGNASSEVRMHVCGADCSGGRAGWREGGIIEELRLENAARNPHYAFPLWDLLLYDKVMSEPNITLLLDCAVFGAVVQDGKIQEVLARCDRTEHIYRIRAAYCADCTGDCRLGLEAGAEFRTGHEARAEFGESLAPEQPGPETLGSSILFTSKNYNTPIPFTPPAWARKITKEQLEFRGIRSWEYGYWWIEWGGALDPIRDNERIRFELLAIVMGVWDYIKNSGEHPDSATWALDWVGMIPGKRGSRRIVGPHVLTQGDCEGGWRSFHDGVSIGGWSFDDHPSGGFDASSEKPARQIKMSEPYNIPLRSMFSANVQNLFMAGRNISASYVAFTSTRVMATCAGIGQAIGTAAAVCVKRGLSPAALVADRPAVAWLRQTLLRDDQTIRECVNEDPGDFARSAKVSASGLLEEAPPEHVLSGETRDLPKTWANRWAGPMTEQGAWVALTWDQPQEIGHVQITFDSGFDRALTLSEQASYVAHMVKGPQPETVRDYTLAYQPEEGGEFVELAQVTGNFQRLRRHTFAPVKTRSLRLWVHATHGVNLALVYEIRCYAGPPSI